MNEVASLAPTAMTTLDIVNTRITDAGVKDFNKSLPNVLVLH